MNNWTVKDIKNFGFEGFAKISELRNDHSKIPKERGIYLILNQQSHIAFLEIGTGGYFKNKNPNCDLKILKAKWVPKAEVIYIGQAGGIRNGKWSNSTLQKRIKDYLNFGNGKSVGHYGGRYIWQLTNNKDLIVCWKQLPNKIYDPCKLESELIEKFKTFYGNWPFANLKG